MNKEEKYTTQPYNPSITKSDVYISSGTQNIETLTRWQDPTIEKLQQENKELQQKVNQLETNRDEAIEYATNEMRIVNDNEYHRLIEILGRGKE